MMQELEIMPLAEKMGSLPLDDRLRAVLDVGTALEKGQERRTEAMLVRLKADPYGDATERLIAVFTRGLEARLYGDTSGQGNLYDRITCPEDMIAAFEVLVQSTPLVTFGHRAATTAIAAALDSAEAVHLVDLGIGVGSQWPALIRQLGHRTGGAPRVRLTGVDLPASSDDPEAALREVGRRLQEAAKAAGVSLHYHMRATRVETLEAAALDLHDDECLAINASLALHHVPDGRVDPAAPRDAVLRRLRALEPAVVTLVEPDAEHNTLPFLPRLWESLRHYGTVFDVLDTLLPRDLRERQTIEQAFFGSEIMNHLGGEGAARMERHERHSQWARRLREAGFRARPMAPYRAEVEAALTLQENFSVMEIDEALVLAWQGVPILAASAWMPA
jgi:hypothetical protein